MNEPRSEKKYGLKAFIPLAVFLVLYVGVGLIFAIMGREKPFNIMPRYVAILAGILAGLFCMDRKTPLADKLDVYYKSAGATGPMTFALVVLMAGGFAGACSAIGGKTAMVNICLSMIPAKFLVAGVFAICAIISTCIGSSMGTVSVMGPIAIALAEGTGLNLAMVSAAVLTGSTFGDNLSMISDTTICATKGVGADMKDKFRANAWIAIPSALLVVVLYVILGTVSNAGTPELEAYNALTAVPYVAVLILALCGLDVIIVLAIGMGLACVIGLCTGTGFFAWASGVSSGMEGMFWVCVFVMMVSGMIGLVRYYGGIEYLVEKAKKIMKSEKSCMLTIWLFPLVLAGIIVNNTLSIIISAPIAKELGEKYSITPKIMACLLDIGACIGPMLVPHGTVMNMVIEYAGCSYVDILKYAFYPMILLVVTAVFIMTGLLGKIGGQGKAE